MVSEKAFIPYPPCYPAFPCALAHTQCTPTSGPKTPLAPFRANSRKAGAESQAPHTERRNVVTPVDLGKTHACYPRSRRLAPGKAGLERRVGDKTKKGWQDAHPFSTIYL